MRYLLIALLALTGCANLTPAELRQAEPRHYNLVGSPLAAAKCIQKNVENHDGAWSADIREREVLVRIHGQVMGLIELAPIAPNLTRAALYLGRTFPRDEIATMYVSGC